MRTVGQIIAPVTRAAVGAAATLADPEGRSSDRRPPCPDPGRTGETPFRPYRSGIPSGMPYPPRPPPWRGTPSGEETSAPPGAKPAPPRPDPAAAKAARVAWKIRQEREAMAARLAAEKRAILERGRG